jgi:hypothetical protein
MLIGGRGWLGVRERDGVQSLQDCLGLPPSFVSKRIRQGEKERGRVNSRLVCLPGRVGEEKRKKEKKRMRFSEFGQNSFKF